MGSENSKQLTLNTSLEKELERLAQKRRDMETLRMNHAAEHEQRQGMIHELERQVDDISKEHELARVQLAFQKSERIRLNVTLRRTVQEVWLA